MDATQTEIQRLAKVAAQSFEVATRDNGDEFYHITDGSPEWVTDLVHAAHGSDFLPDDYRYKWAADACEWIAESDDPDDVGEFADSAVDVYTGRRLAWLASNLNRPSYCDDAVADMGGYSDGEYGRGGGERLGIIDMIGLGQYAEASEVYGLVLSFLEDSVAAL